MFVWRPTEALRTASDMELAILVPRGIDAFPAKKEPVSGTIDVWWIVRILKSWCSCNVKCDNMSP